MAIRKFLANFIKTMPLILKIYAIGSTKTFHVRIQILRTLNLITLPCNVVEICISIDK